jgi:histidinol-phosphate aminotransferase
MNPFRPEVQRIVGYAPGEQPQETGWYKLNTNENPYPPSPAVVEAIQQAATTRLNFYPDPFALSFREAAAELFDVEPDWILPANGSDENLTILMRSFISPGELVSYPFPSYILYETLADIQGAKHERIVLNSDWSFSEESADVVSRSKLVLIPNPNSPSGNRWPDEVIQTLVPSRGIFVLDEAYGDFCDEPHRGQLLHQDCGDRLVITRTLSKSYGLAGIRFGFAIARPELISGMQKVKDSYNCNSISIAAATAAIRDQSYMLQTRERILATRARLTDGLQDLGFDVVPSQANFVWSTHPSGEHERLYQQLKERKILVRYMKFAGSRLESPQSDGLRVTVGTDEQIDRFLQALTEVV